MSSTPTTSNNSGARRPRPPSATGTKSPRLRSLMLSTSAGGEARRPKRSLSMDGTVDGVSGLLRRNGGGGTSRTPQDDPHGAGRGAGSDNGGGDDDDDDDDDDGDDDDEDEDEDDDEDDRDYYNEEEEDDAVVPSLVLDPRTPSPQSPSTPPPLVTVVKAPPPLLSAVSSFNVSELEDHDPLPTPMTPAYPSSVRSVFVRRTSEAISVLQPMTPSTPDSTVSTALDAVSSAITPSTSAANATANASTAAASATKTIISELRTRTTFAEFVRGELTNDEFDDLDRIKIERISNILQIPVQFEQFVAYSSLVCLDVFLSLFGLLPLRFVIALVAFVLRLVRVTDRMRSSHKSDLLKGMIFIVSCVVVLNIDGSRLYHIIRGQNTLKLYVIYNVLEVLDRLCSAFGQDVMDSLLSKATISALRPRYQLQRFPHVLIAVGYMFVHSLIIFLELVTLNVAVNSFSASLLTVLLSNQFAEIKSNVFKKVTKENLWQVACSDTVERFQLGVFLVLIWVRNWAEMGDSFDYNYIVSDFLPQLLALYFSEVIIDWLKHAFITKFNRIPATAYSTFSDILCRDLVVQRSPNLGSYDQTPLVARRLGFAAMPLACVTVRVLTEVLEALNFKPTWYLAAVGAMLFVCLFLLKLILGIAVLGVASRRCLNSDVFNVDLYASKYAFADDLVDRFTQQGPPAAPNKRDY